MTREVARRCVEMKEIIKEMKEMEKKEAILNRYYADNAGKLHKMVDGILIKFGGLSDKDLDDFYSLANEVFVEVIRRYDGSQAFESFLYSCLCNRIKTEITRRNREKRRADRVSVPIDTPIGDDDNNTLGDMIADRFDLEREILEEQEGGYSPRVQRYLGRLSGLQKEVLWLGAAGYLPGEIREELHISEKQYADCYAAIHSYRNISLLL